MNLKEKGNLVMIIEHKSGWIAAANGLSCKAYRRTH